VPHEADRRREGFDPDRSRPVVLSDGKEWFLPRPYIAINAIWEDGKPVGSYRSLRYGPEIDGLLRAISEADSVDASIVLVLALGAMLLDVNYELSDEDLAEVLVYQIDDPTFDQIVREILDVATGGLFQIGGRGVLDDPKPQSSGQDARS